MTPQKFAPESPELVALATTCRILSEHALNVLWKELPSLIPLVMTMPSDLIAWSSAPYAPWTDSEVDVLVSLCDLPILTVF